MTDVKLKILLHTPDFPPWDGGIAAAAFDIAKCLTLFGHQVVVVAQNLTDSDSKWDKQQKFKIIRVRNISSSIIKYNLLKWKTRKIVSDFKPDILFAFSWRYSGLVCSSIKESTGIPLVQFYHGNEIFDRRRKKKYWENLFQRAQKNTDLSIANSNYTAEALRSTLSFPIEVDVMMLGVDLTYFKPSSDLKTLKKSLDLSGRKVILTLARVVKRKNHLTVINTLPELVKICPSLLYVIAGRGEYLSVLKARVEELGLQLNVRFTGFLSNEDKLKFYQACDVYVMTSSSSMTSGDLEGFGLTYLEANACGKPVIGGDEGGVLDAIKDGVNGFLVKPHDGVKLSQHLKALLLCEDNYRELSKSSLDYVREVCGWQMITQGLVKKLDKVFLNSRLESK